MVGVLKRRDVTLCCSGSIQAPATESCSIYGTEKIDWLWLLELKENVAYYAAAVFMGVPCAPSRFVISGYGSTRKNVMIVDGVSVDALGERYCQKKDGLKNTARKVDTKITKKYQME